MRAFLADDALAVHDASAVDESLKAPEGLDRDGDGGLRARLIADVGTNEPCRLAKRRRKRFALVDFQIRDDDTRTTADQHAGRRSAKARCAAGDDEGSSA